MRLNHDELLDNRLCHTGYLTVELFMPYWARFMGILQHSSRHPRYVSSLIYVISAFLASSGLRRQMETFSA